MTHVLHRRTALAAVAAVPAAMALGSVPARAAQDLDSLIAEHKAAMRRLTAAVEKHSGFEDVFSISEVWADEQSDRVMAAGVPEAREAMSEAYDLEEEVRVRLVTYAPATEQEATRKKRYMARSEPFTWDGVRKTRASSNASSNT